MDSARCPGMRSKSILPLIGLAFAAWASIVGVVLVFHFWKGVPVGYMTRDVATVAVALRYAGFLSQMGLFIWFAAATLCLFSAMVLLKHPDHRELKRYFLVSGLLTLLLAFDDAFLLHEWTQRDLRLPEELVFGCYAGLLILYLLRYRALILQTDYVLMALALFFFAASVLLDIWHPRIPYFVLYEDGAKLAGQVSWLAYFARLGTCAAGLNAARRTA